MFFKNLLLSLHRNQKVKEILNMNALESLIAVLSTPVAKKKGVTISAEDCKVWVEELRNYEEHVTSELKKYYELKTK